MRLLRVQVPEFRALKNVDITFEKDFLPAVFPIGSQNGGGKSTLLQLIFTLLHCSFHSDRKQFLKNILQNLDVNPDPTLLARLYIFDIEYEDEIILEFFTINDNIKIDAEIENDDKSNNKIFVDLEFSSSQRLENLNSKLLDLKKSKEMAEKLRNQIMFDAENLLAEGGSKFKKGLYNLIDQTMGLIPRLDALLSSTAKLDEISDSESLMLAKKVIEKIIPEIDSITPQILAEISMSSEDLTSTLIYLKKEDFNFVCTYESIKNQTGALLSRCKSEKIDIDLFKEKISKKVFLAAPSTQVFIFTSKEVQQLLFKTDNQAKVYHSLVKSLETDLSGLFTYDFLSVDLLIDAFKAARDQDFRTAIKSGIYGHSYQTLINDLNLMLGNKKININPDLSEIIFKLSSSSGDEIDLYPENLSHGELKRLSLYMWIKSRLIEDSIVLMDEVEIAFHPDWQYQIVSDLAHWAPSNQYILATHSYELCQAVTPAHVKELEPKLLKAEI